ncbi:phosphatase PAP2 family protein [Streptomyces celluloflavus]|uniref:Phosphatase PAP2 family protein n=2 Tax=Streptomyces TaxID=1883 RepID=A0A4Q9HMR9_STRKA|nr:MULTISPECIES: phosphatase PAP2 family protein [Streptomyces]MYU57119.1 phosphatase PAP2 family protein [Streptomyces sp. SID7805]TBO56107.1 phosphatase PAP2 family protein [Streptomyces kasugaensis]WSK13261.1 phosphatase PAP2 family protein [Streptomyces celluloflavus]
MAGLALEGPNPDVDVLDGINGLAKGAPHWVNRAMEFIGEYGIIAGLAVLCLIAWWSARRKQDAPAAVAGLVWAPLAAGLALLANIPIRAFVSRPRPFNDHAEMTVLIQGKTDFSFVSDHATLTMAVAAGLFIVHRVYGLIGIGLALLEGFCRVYMGVHYPTDVVGGFALGTAVALLLAPLAQALLVPLATTVGRSKAGWLVQAPAAAARAAAEAGAAGRAGQDAAGGQFVTTGPPLPPRHDGRDKDLAA